MGTRERRKGGHRTGCTGHIDRPDCGPDVCAMAVVLEVSDRGTRADTVVCLACYRPFRVDDGGDARPAGGFRPAGPGSA